MNKKKCTVLEKLLYENWFTDEKEANTWVLMKKVLINDAPVWSLSEKIPRDSVVRIKEYYKRQYVNKGGYKLERALKTFQIDPTNQVVLDCGASTGGFTDCWLQHGARKVYSVDVGFGQLAGKLAIDDRVVNLEKTNLSDHKLTILDPRPDMISLDLSYLSLKKALPLCQNILKERGVMICLVKPIYEVQSSEIRRNGNINQKDILKDILMDLCKFYIEQQLEILGITNSPVTGNSGTLEYLIGVYWNREGLSNVTACFEQEVDRALKYSMQLKKYKKE